MAPTRRHPLTRRPGQVLVAAALVTLVVLPSAAATIVPPDTGAERSRPACHVRTHPGEDCTGSPAGPVG